MSAQAWIQLAAYMALLVGLGWPLGRWMADVAQGRFPRWMAPLVRAEHALYRAAGVDPAASTGWKAYATALIAFNAVGLAVVYALQRLQGALPLNPQSMAAVAPDSAFNTAVSFVTNTDWQGYGGESTMSDLTQTLALGVQMFLSAATGIAVAVALIRGFAARGAGRAGGGGIGNFWVDATRMTLYVLVPMSTVLAVFLASQGVVQNFDPYKEATTLEANAYQVPKNGPDGRPLKDAKGDPATEDARATTQTLPMGPAASLVAIKQLGTNGGGFFNANSAHPYENPTPLTNFVELLAILLIPAALCFTFGSMVGDRRQGLAIFAAMTAIFLAAVLAITPLEQRGNPGFDALGVDQAQGATQSGGNMEGKETRFGIASSALWAVATTAASNGSVNSMHDSYTPLAGGVPMGMIQLGEVVYGGVGSGLYGMLVYAILAVFIAGLMIGRTPEYLGKKIEPFEMKMAAIAILATPALVLAGTAVAVALPQGAAGVANPGAHGFSEILYALGSAGNNNGSAFAGLSANTPFWNTLLGVVMFFGRYAIIVPVLAIAGSLAAKKRIPATAGTLPTHGALFVALLIGVVVLVGLLNYVPALALGPVAEQLTLARTR
ncbi:MAG: potassium-transporting ATPase subunit KdpA [Burkholderiaceae bacterium]